MNLKGVKKEVWVGIAALALVLINNLLTGLGLNPIAVSGDQMYKTGSDVATIIVAAWMAYKNNSVTIHAQTADVFMKRLKDAAMQTIIDQSKQMLAESAEVTAGTVNINNVATTESAETEPETAVIPEATTVAALTPTLTAEQASAISAVVSGMVAPTGTVAQ
ncbi:phage holin [Acetobacterium tundrae]|uniref:Phage holin n=1 Tax=Acetobacterium tundrae TaxID=132932 RepID=A0ABR6WJV9_9FIRM|nr:phage holin [Acetobacterium tundrae]MBC3796422.1 hypothetical protein [Acetobacterium tundrae]